MVKYDIGSDGKKIAIWIPNQDQDRIVRKPNTCVVSNMFLDWSLLVYKDLMD